MQTDLPLDALEMALWRRGGSSKMITSHHSRKTVGSSLCVFATRRIWIPVPRTSDPSMKRATTLASSVRMYFVSRRLTV